MFRRRAVLFCAFACLLGCQAAEPVKPLSPLEVQLLVQAAVKGLLMTKPATETELLALRAWVQAARVTTTEDLAQSLTTLSEHAPDGWRDLVAVGSGILLERVGLADLLTQGEEALAQQYIRAMLAGFTGAIDQVLTRRAKPLALVQEGGTRWVWNG